MPSSPRKEHRKHAVEMRLAHLDAHTPHLAAIAMADEDMHDSMRAMLRKMDQRLHAAVDTLLEYSLPALKPEYREEVEKYLSEGNTQKARNWIAGSGYEIVHDLAKAHIDSHLAPHGGSFLSWIKGVGHSIAHGFRKVGHFFTHLVTGASKTAGKVAKNLAPVADVAVKVAPAVAAAAKMA